MCWNHVHVSSTSCLPAAIRLWRNEFMLLNIVSLSNFNWTNFQNEYTRLCFATHWCCNCIAAGRKDREKPSCTFRLVITQFSTREPAFISIWSAECQHTVKASTIWQSWGWCIPIACFLWPTNHMTVTYKQKTKNALTLGKAGANESGIFAFCQINWLKKWK